MNANKRWKRGSRLDNILNVLLIVLALGVLGLGAVEHSIDSAQVAETSPQQI